MAEIKTRDAEYLERRVKDVNNIISNPTNQKLVKQFVSDCLLGKTVKNRAKKTIGKARLSGYLSFIKLMDHYFKKPFTRVDLKDIENFIRDLQEDKIQSKWKKPYTEESKHSIKATLLKFFRWLYEDDLGKYHKLTGWIETYVVRHEIQALNKTEIDKVVENAPDMRLKTFFLTLFDSGARITEYLNIRWQDIEYSEKAKCFKMRIRQEASKTFGRTITLPLSTTAIKDWKNLNPDAKPEDYFMPITHRNATALINRWTRKTLGKQVGCHVFGRHSSATYYASKLMPYVFCKRFGWSMGSRMAQRYIDKEGIEMEEATEKINEDIVRKYETEISRVKEESSIKQMEMDERMKMMEDNMKKMQKLLANEEISKLLKAVPKEALAKNN